MSQTLSDQIAALPEVYQVIYGHPEFNRQASRLCQARLEAIGSVCEHLSSQLNRPLRILDLGCAQGFFSLSLAAKGATVTAIDFQAENIALCRTLAEENPQLAVTFIQGQIEDAIEALQSDQYDLALGLSVFHHIVHLHGVQKAQHWINQLVNNVSMAIFELAQQQEPLYWASSQPENACSLIEQSAFWHQIASSETHLSPIDRPLYVASNHYLLLGDFCRRFSCWRAFPYAGGNENAHNRSRRYYFGEGFFCKLIDLTSPDRRVLAEVLTRNQEELNREVNLLRQPPPGLVVPRLITYGDDERHGWLVVSQIEGELISDLLLKNSQPDADKVLEDLLQQLVVLEQVGLYHDDVRLWNLIYDSQRQSTTLIDYGSVGRQPLDCVWPHNVFQAFFILVNELLLPGLAQPGSARPVLLSPFHLPSPYANWLYAFWQMPISSWRFSTLAELFARRESLPAIERSGAELWLEAQELRLQDQLQHSTAQSGIVETLSQQATQLTARMALLEQHFPQLQQDYRQQQQRLQEIALQQQQLERQTLPALKSELVQSREEYARLERERQEMAASLQAFYQSRSWRITAPYRYLGRQYKLLRQYGVTQRSGQLAKRLLKATFSFTLRHPVFKHRLFQLLHKMRLYDGVKRLYRRAWPSETGANNTSAQQQIQQQLIEPSRVPPAVHEIFRRLR